jgi:hypothetical protein
LKVYTVTLYKINMALELEELYAKPLTEVIPKEYHELLPLFDKVIVERLPVHSPYDHKIKLQQEFTLPFRPIYNMSRGELQVLNEWIGKESFQRIHSIITIALWSPCTSYTQTKWGSPTVFRLLRIERRNN